MTDLATFFDTLKADALRYAVLRNHADLPTDWGNDVDILVAADDLESAIRCLFQVFDLANVPHQRMLRFHFLSFRFQLCERELQVDFYTAITKGWFQYANAQYVLDRSCENEAGIRIPHPSDEVRLIAAKELFSYGYLREKYHAQFRAHQIDRIKANDALFSNRLTPSSTALIDQCVVAPSTRGRPHPTIKSLIAPINFMRWMKLRRGQFKKVDCNV